MPDKFIEGLSALVMPSIRQLCNFLISFLICCQILYGQQEITPLPLDKLNRDSLYAVVQQKERENDYRALGALYGGIYNYYLYSNPRDSAIKYAIKAEENTYKAGDSARYYFIQLQLGEYHTNSLDFKNALIHFEKALRYYARIKNYTLQSASLGSLSYMYEVKKDTSNQLKYLNLAEKIILISKDTFNMVGANDKRAGIMMTRGQPDSAISLLKKNLFLLDHVKKFGNGEHIKTYWKGWQLNKLADCYYRKKNYQLAIKYLKEALPYDTQTSGFDAQNIFRYRFLIKSYIQTNEKDSAIKYLETFFKQSIKTLENINPEKLNEISTKYEAEKKQREIADLQQKNKVQELTVSNQRKLNTAFIIIVLLLLATGSLIINNIRQKRKITAELAKKELLEQQQQHKEKELAMRNRITRDLHDDVGATLSSVKAYSEILKNNPDNPVIAELIKENAAEMIEKLEVIAWATNPHHDNFNSLKSKMMKFAAPICHSRNIQFNIESNGLNEEMLVPGEVRQNIFLVFKESVNNMIKYAEATECKAKMFVSNNHFILQIEDNGKGTDGIIKGNGSGWINMRKRTDDLKGTLDIHSASGKGTVISMSLPYPFKIPNSWDRNPHNK